VPSSGYRPTGAAENVLPTARRSSPSGIAGRNRSALSLISGPHTYTSMSSRTPTDVLMRPP
jgi:hypothetical protein